MATQTRRIPTLENRAPSHLATPPSSRGHSGPGCLDGCPTTATTGVAPHIAVTTYPYGAQLVTVNGGGHT